MGRVLLVLGMAAGMFFPGLSAAVGIGEKAPLFTAESHLGEVALGDYLGRKNVILAFYFAINTPA